MEMKTNHYEYLQKNFSIDSNCLTLCMKRKIPTAIMLSSVTCFPEHSVDVFSESSLHHGSLITGIYGYAASKRNTLDLCRCAYLDSGLNAIPVVLGNCYGVYGRFSTNGTIVHKLIYDISVAIRENKDVFLTGDGLDVRTFLFASDLKSILLDIASRDMRGMPVVIASPEQITIKELSHLIADLMGHKKEIIFDGRPTPGHRRKVATSEIINIRDYDITSLEEGLKQTIKFYWRQCNEAPI